jgi:translocation and assembly module TamA
MSVMGSAQAFEFLGIKFFEDQSEIDAESVIADPQPYTAELVTSASDGLGATIRQASRLLAGQAEPASGAAGLLARARGDYKRILGALYDEGYYGGAISILVDGREAAGLPPDITLP